MWIGRLYSLLVKSLLLHMCGRWLDWKNVKDVNAMITWRCREGPFVGSRSPNVEGGFDGPNIKHVWLSPSMCKFLCLFWSSVCWSLVDHWWVHYSQVPSSRMSWTCSKSEPLRRRWLLLRRAVCPKWPNFWRVMSDGPLTWARCLGGSSADKLFDQDFNEHFRFLDLRCFERMRGLQLNHLESAETCLPTVLTQFILSSTWGSFQHWQRVVGIDQSLRGFGTKHLRSTAADGCHVLQAIRGKKCWEDVVKRCERGEDRIFAEV